MKKFEFENCLRYAQLINETVKRKTNEIVYACMHSNGDVCIDSAAVLNGDSKKVNKIIQAFPAMWKHVPRISKNRIKNPILFFEYQGGLIEDQL